MARDVSKILLNWIRPPNFVAPNYLVIFPELNKGIRHHLQFNFLCQNSVQNDAHPTALAISLVGLCPAHKLSSFSNADIHRYFDEIVKKQLGVICLCQGFLMQYFIKVQGQICPQVTTI